MIRVAPLTGEALDAALDDVAKLRIKVFRAWPYLYDGDLDYERNYLESYRKSEGAVVVGAFDGSRLVGAATGTPMQDHAAEFAAPFASVPVPIKNIFYCAESVLLPEFRGLGIGHSFFDSRESHAKSLGATHTTFCAVLRPADHPARPAAYRPLDAFWQKRGYAPLDGVVARFTWKDVGEAQATEKPLQFWMRTL